MRAEGRSRRSRSQTARGPVMAPSSRPSDGADGEPDEHPLGGDGDVLGQQPALEQRRPPAVHTIAGERQLVRRCTSPASWSAATAPAASAGRTTPRPMRAQPRASRPRRAGRALTAAPLGAPVAAGPRRGASAVPDGAVRRPGCRSAGRVGSGPASGMRAGSACVDERVVDERARAPRRSAPGWPRRPTPRTRGRSSRARRSAPRPAPGRRRGCVRSVITLVAIGDVQPGDLGQQLRGLLGVARCAQARAFS